MIKTPQDRSDRTYSVPSAGHVGGIHGPAAHNSGYNNGPGSHQNHNYMLPLSPGGNNSHHGGHQGSSITPKTTTHA